MKDDTILLLGIDEKKTALNEAREYTRYQELLDTYGETSVFAGPFRTLQEQFGAENISVLNLDSWDDLKEKEELFRQQYYTYIVPLGLRLSDSYDNILENKRYLYAQLLVWMTGRTASTIVMTGVHASLFNTLTEYLAYEKQEVKEVSDYLFNLQGNNLVYVSNSLVHEDYANVILTGLLLDDVGSYPSSDALPAACWDIDYSDISMDLVWFRNNHLRPVTVENLKNFASEPFIKSVLVDRIIKYIKNHWPDQNGYIGTAFSDYKLVKIAEQAEEYLKTLTGWILYDYDILSVTTEQYADSSVGIHVRYEVWPKFTVEKYTDEVIL